MELLLAIDFTNLHTVLEGLYDEMMPLCEDMLDVGKGLAGLGALFYVASRVWQSLARAEPIDVYPLLRPFAIGICILLFPTLVLGTLNEGLGLIVRGTHSMVEEQTLDMERYRAQKDELEREAMMRSPETAFLVSDEEFDRQLDELGWTPETWRRGSECTSKWECTTWRRKSATPSAACLSCSSRPPRCS